MGWLLNLCQSDDCSTLRLFKLKEALLFPGRGRLQECGSEGQSVDLFPSSQEKDAGRIRSSCQHVRGGKRQGGGPGVLDSVHPAVPKPHCDSELSVNI